MREAVQLVLQDELSASNGMAVSIANNDSGAYQVGADKTIRVTLEDREGRIRCEATVRRVREQRNEEPLVAEAPPHQLITGLDAIAHRIDPHAAQFSTRSDKALQVFTTALGTTDRKERVELLTNAIGNDPSFGLAYTALIGTAAQGGADLGSAIQNAKQHWSAFSPVDRARLQSVITRITSAPLEAQASATAALVRLTPNDANELIVLGSDLFLLGDSAGGERALQRALLLNPGNAAVRAQLAEGLFETKNFAAAEKLFTELSAQNPSLQVNLAICALLEGSTRRADDVMNRFLKSVQNPSLATLLRSSWLAISGRLSEAISSLESAQFPNPTLKALALSATSIWQLMGGDSGEARKTAEAAVTQGGQSSFGSAALLVAEGGQAPEQWRAAVERSPFDPANKETLLGYGFFLNGRYQQAADIWSELLKRSGGKDLRARLLLAASLRKLGKTSEANAIKVQPFFPDLGDMYAAISFRELRAMLH